MFSLSVSIAWSNCVVIVCLVVLRRLDESVAGVFKEGVSVEQKEQDQGHFVKQGKLFSELAPQIYASTLITCFTFKAKIYKTFFPKLYGNYFATLCRSIR